MGNHVSSILDLLPARTWKHVPTATNPGYCASRGLLLQELISHNLWWKGPPWLQTEPPQLPLQPLSSLNIGTSELKTVCSAITTTSPEWIEDRFSSFTHFAESLHGCSDSSTISEHAKNNSHAFSLILSLQMNSNQLSSFSIAFPSADIFQTSFVICQQENLRYSSLSQSQKHPIILHAKDRLTSLLVLSKHLSLLHSGPTLLLSILGSTYHIIGAGQDHLPQLHHLQKEHCKN